MISYISFSCDNLIWNARHVSFWVSFFAFRMLLAFLVCLVNSQHFGWKNAKGEKERKFFDSLKLNEMRSTTQWATSNEQLTTTNQRRQNEILLIEYNVHARCFVAKMKKKNKLKFAIFMFWCFSSLISLPNLTSVCSFSFQNKYFFHYITWIVCFSCFWWRAFDSNLMSCTSLPFVLHQLTFYS